MQFQLEHLQALMCLSAGSEQMFNKELLEVGFKVWCLIATGTIQKHDLSLSFCYN